MIYTTIEETPQRVLLELLEKFNYEPSFPYYYVRYQRHPSTGAIKKDEQYSFNCDMIEGIIEYTKEDVIKQLFYNKVENLLND